jgi:hypothetical protein
LTADAKSGKRVTIFPSVARSSEVRRREARDHRPDDLQAKGPCKVPEGVVVGHQLAVGGGIAARMARIWRGRHVERLLVRGRVPPVGGRVARVHPTERSGDVVHHRLGVRRIVPDVGILAALALLLALLEADPRVDLVERLLEVPN